MKILGLVFSLGAILWVMLQVTGGEDAQSVIPEGHQTALKKAESVEQQLQETMQKKIGTLEEHQ